MSGIVVRAPRDGDAEAVLAVHVARDVADTGEPDYTLDDVRSDFVAPETDNLLAEVGGRVVAAAVLDARGAMVSVHPGEDDPGVDAAVLEVLERRARERGMDVMRVHVSAANERSRERLAAAGYAPAFYFSRLQAPASALPSAPPALPGRRAYMAGDEKACYRVIREAFADIPGQVLTSYELFRKDLARSAFAPDLSYVVEDEGTIVGCVLCERREGEGYVADLAVVRAARGRGLGRGLLLSALAAFRADGRDGASLWVNGANTPALGLYESCALRETHRGERWEKPLA